MFDPKAKPGTVSIVATDGKGHEPEFWAERAAERIMQVSETAHPAIKAQAKAFKEQIRREVYWSILNAILSDRQTMAAELESSGYPKLAEQVKFFRNQHRKIGRKDGDTKLPL